MSAIEMMDPKMDIGIMHVANSKKPHTFETAVAAGALKLSGFQDAELIGIFDSIFSCLVCWLDGHSLDQVLFTCLYLHNPHDIEDKILKIFCLAVRKLVPIIKDFILEGNVCEEEDFQLFGVSNLGIIDSHTENQIIFLLKEAEDDLMRKSRLDSYDDDLTAIMHRTRFLRSLFQSIFLLWPRKNEILNECVLVDVQKNLNAALELLPLIKNTVVKGIQSDPASGAPHPTGYSPRVNQRNLPPTFPRSAKIRDRSSSFIFLEELCKKFKLACKIFHQKDYYSALNFFVDFSKGSSQCLLSRSVIQIIFFQSKKQTKCCPNPFEEFLKESIKSFTAPPVLVNKNQANAEAQKYVDSFLKYCLNMHTFTYFIQICGYNRARQRDKLARLIEEGFCNLQSEAARVDTYLNMMSRETESNNPHISHFGTWTLYYCLRAMSLYLLSGFELELYSIHEFLYIYWYLYEFLFAFIVTTLSRADSLLVLQDTFDAQNRSHQRQRKNKLRKKKPVKQFLREIMYNHAMQMMSGGYYKAILGFTKIRKIRQPKSKFDNEEIRFNHRFASFANLSSPPPIAYSEYLKICNAQLCVPSAELFLSAANHFHQARSILESILHPDAEMLQLIHVAKINFVVGNLLANGHKKDSNRQPEFDFSHHCHFPIIKIN